MTQRFTLDRCSFEQFLAAASLLQQFQKRAFEDRAAAQPLWELVDLQRGIDTSSLDLNTVIQHVPRLAWELVGGTGAGVWLFNTEDEFVWRAGTGGSQTDEHLRLEILSRLAALGEGSDIWRNARHNWDDGYYPGCAKSLLVEPIRLNEDIAGAVAVFATEFDAFTERDASKVRLLATLLGYALQRSFQVGKVEAAALLPGEVREVMKREIPRLQDLLEYQEEERPAIPVADYDFENSPRDNAGAEAEEPLFAYSSAQEPLEELSPLQQRQEVESGDALCESTEPGSLADIYVPGIGVRAALGGNDEEPKPSRVWMTLRYGFSALAAAIAAVFTYLFSGIRRAAIFVLQSIVYILKATGRGVARVAGYRPKLPATASIRSQLAILRSLCGRSMRAVGSGLRTTSPYIRRPKVHRPSLPAESVQQRVQWAGAWARKRLHAIGRSLRHAPNLVPSWPAFPIDKIGRNLSNGASAVSRGMMRSAKSFGNEFSQLRFPEAWQWNVNPRHVRRVAPAMIVLAVMLAFLLAQAGLHKNMQIASASTTASVPPAAVVLPTPKLTSASVPASNLANSPTHRQITDPETKDNVENMTRYEIATVRRAALYGDDVSAFQLGMAYEIGYGMTQNCKKAAEWVTRAADEGNPAAEYNLGLRYRDGDGVTPSPTEAEKWLKKAAEHKYGNAASVLASAR